MTHVEQALYNILSNKRLIAFQKCVDGSKENCTRPNDMRISIGALCIIAL